jgi:hypothetical protein
MPNLIHKLATTDIGVLVAGILGAVPAGAILMWSGTLASVPSGWKLCDGTNGTPDLRDRFIYGWTAGADPGGTGGTSTHSHDDHAAHSHGPGTLGGTTGVNSTQSAQLVGVINVAADGHTHGFSVTTGATANNSAQSHSSANHLPPYFKLAFIMKT